MWFWGEAKLQWPIFVEQLEMFPVNGAAFGFHLSFWNCIITLDCVTKPFYIWLIVGKETICNQIMQPISYDAIFNINLIYGIQKSF